MTTEQTDYIRLRFPNSDNDEQLQAVLHSLEPLGFLEEQSYWEVYFTTHAWEGGMSETFIAALQRLGITTPYETEAFKKQNWNKEWEESIVPVQVSDRIVITPSWHTVPTDHTVITLIIDPKMSFGTGFHATTRLMLRLMEQYVRVQDVVLDVGTGSGILAIAAIKLGAALADGVDIDEWSKENARENCVRNAVQEQVRIFQGSLETVNGPYDLILSNITRNDNIIMLPSFAAMMPKGGRLLLSGFYDSDSHEIAATLRKNGFTVMQDLAEEKWQAICGVKTTS